MQRYIDEVAYLRAFAIDPKLAIMGIGMVSNVLGIGRGAVEQRIAKGTLDAVQVGKSVHVLTCSMLDHQAAEDKMRETVLKTLKNLAKTRQTMIYSALMAQVGFDYRLSPHRNKIGAILGFLSEQTYAESRVLISVLVVDKKTGMPNPSFFGLLDRLTGKPHPDHEKTFSAHKQAVYKAYG